MPRPYHSQLLHSKDSASDARPEKIWISNALAFHSLQFFSLRAAGEQYRPHFEGGFGYASPFFTGFAAIVAATLATTVALKSIKSARENLIRQLDVQREIAALASRANVVSSNRQKWIDGVRDDLAEFIAADFVVLDDTSVDEGELSEAEQANHRARLAEAMRTRRLMQRRIQLRLNPEKESHNDLYKAVMKLVPAVGKQHRTARVHLVKTAQAFLRQEWLRVKKEAGDWEKINTSGPGSK